MAVLDTSYHSTLERPFGSVESCPEHRALLMAADALPLVPMMEGPPPADGIRLDYSVNAPPAYFPHDFCRMDSAGNHMGSCGSPDPSIWAHTDRVVEDCVVPIDLGLSSEARVTSKPRKSAVVSFRKLPYRPTLDEFMASRDGSYDSDNAPHTKPTHRAAGVAGPSHNPTSSRTALQDTINLTSHLSCSGGFRCPMKGCDQVCKTKGDLGRHLQSSKHSAASVPCRLGCGQVYTREDAEKRHHKTCTLGRRA